MSQNLNSANDQTSDGIDDLDNKFFEEKLKFEQFIDFILDDSSSSKDIIKVCKQIRTSNRLKLSCSKSNI